MQLGADQRIDIETFLPAVSDRDIALGGGIPKGRIVEIYGPEKAAAKQPWLCMPWPKSKNKAARRLLVDAENALDPVYADESV